MAWNTEVKTVKDGVLEWPSVPLFSKTPEGITPPKENEWAYYANDFKTNPQPLF